jgi:hypothetical protein
MEWQTDDTAYHPLQKPRGIMRKYLVMFALLAVVLTACRIESNVILDIEEDGSAVVGAEIGFDEEFRELLGDMGEGSPDDLFGDLPDFGGDDVVQTERTEGDMTFYGVTTAVEDLSTFDSSAAGGEVFETFSYTFDEETATLSATVAPTDLGDAGGDLPIDPSMITEEFFSANVVVSMPGTVSSHDADEVRSDGTLVWKIPFTGSKSISATSDLGSGGTSNLVLIALVVLLVVAAIAVVVVSIMNRRRSQAAVDSAAASHSADMAAAEMVAEGGPVEPGEPDVAVETSTTAPTEDAVTRGAGDAVDAADPDADDRFGGTDEGDQPDRT